MQRRRVGFRAAVLVSLALTVAAACSNTPTDQEPTDTGTTTSEPTEPSVPTRGVTATSVKVGGVTVIEGPGFTYVDQCNGAEALFARVNAEGGVHGRMIDYVGCRDDKVTAELDIEETRRLIEQDEVFAIVPASIIFAGYELAAQANVPYFGWGINPYFCDVPQGFGFNGCTGPTNPEYNFANWAGMVKEVDPSVETVAEIAHDIPAGQVNLAAIGRGNGEFGLETVYSDGSIPLAGVADWTPYAQGILESGADFLEAELAYTIPLFAALKAAGYEGYLLDAVSYNPFLLQDPASAEALEGAYQLTLTEPFESDNAGIQQMIADIEAFGKPDQLLTSELAQGYFSAWLFVDILEQVGPDLTYDSFYEVANGGDYCFDAEGALGTICFPAGHSDSSGCLAMTQVVDGAFEPVLPMTCYPRPGQEGGTAGA